MVYLIYLLLAFIVVRVSVKLSNYVDLLDKTTDISGAFLGGVMLAAVTSLPELFTSISATLFLNQPELVIGNILGSNIFNLSILAILILTTYKIFDDHSVAKSHMFTLKVLMVIYALFGATMIIPVKIEIFSINIVSIVILIVYIFAVKKMSADETEVEEEEEVTTNLTTKQIMIRFSVCSIILVLASIAITYTTDIIAAELNLGKTVAGALLLGIATSLPELTSSIALVKVRNYNAMVGNILGSNLFNFFVIFIADILLVKQTLFIANSQTYSLLIFGVLCIISVYTVLNVKLSDKHSEKTRRAIYLSGSSAALIGYLMFIVTSM